MKRIVMGCVSFLLLSTANAPALRAETLPGVTNRMAVNSSMKANQLTPFNLVYLAYQGYFQEQGIPSNGALINAYYSGSITPQDLVKSAIQKMRLSSQTLSDRDFLAAVDNNLRSLGANE